MIAAAVLLIMMDDNVDAVWSDVSDSDVTWLKGGGVEGELMITMVVMQIITTMTDDDENGDIADYDVVC